MPQDRKLLKPEELPERKVKEVLSRVGLEFSQGYFSNFASRPHKTVQVSELGRRHGPNDWHIQIAIGNLDTAIRDFFNNDEWGRRAPFRPTFVPDGSYAFRLEFVENIPIPGLKIFLCHSSSDKEHARDMHRRLDAAGSHPWLDEVNLLPGQNWDLEIRKALRSAHVVLVILSRAAINKEGFIQKEIRIALDIADEKPDGTIYIVPARIEECEVPYRLRQWHWVDLFGDNGYENLLRSLNSRFKSINHQD
jgi:hypothetical protein